MDISNINKDKAVFDDIYVADDPRSYFSVLGSLDYMIPDVAEPVIRQILAARATASGHGPTVLDVGSSYGINAAIHRFPVNFSSLRQRYARREMVEVAPDEMARLDRHFYASWPEIGVGRFIGLDVSEPAIRYANRAGLHIDGVVANLETEALSARDAAVLAPVDVLLSTGSIGYVTARTYDRLLDAVTEAPWIISFVLRMFPYDGFIESFARRGMVTERLRGATFVQRRFRDEAEFEKCLASLEAQGIDPAGIESEGLFQAELFLSRPEADALAAPLDDIVSVTSGGFNAFGPRYLQVGSEDGPAHTLTV
ncbi:MAG: class I SAM-dependent methyltransferase [Brevundimonas sp.]|nr:class I SAM-dependent methyltransferase [Brevundimonas sp.]